MIGGGGFEPLAVGGPLQGVEEVVAAGRRGQGADEEPLRGARDGLDRRGRGVPLAQARIEADKLGQQDAGLGLRGEGGPAAAVLVDRDGPPGAALLPGRRALALEGLQVGDGQAGVGVGPAGPGQVGARPAEEHAGLLGHDHAAVERDERRRAGRGLGPAVETGAGPVRVDDDLGDDAHDVVEHAVAREGSLLRDEAQQDLDLVAVGRAGQELLEGRGRDVDERRLARSNRGRRHDRRRRGGEDRGLRDDGARGSGCGHGHGRDDRGDDRWSRGHDHRHGLGRHDERGSRSREDRGRSGDRSRRGDDRRGHRHGNDLRDGDGRGRRDDRGRDRGRSGDRSRRGDGRRSHRHRHGLGNGDRRGCRSRGDRGWSGDGSRRDRNRRRRRNRDRSGHGSRDDRDRSRSRSGNDRGRGSGREGDRGWGRRWDRSRSPRHGGKLGVMLLERRLGHTRPGQGRLVHELELLQGEIAAELLAQAKGEDLPVLLHDAFDGLALLDGQVLLFLPFAAVEDEVDLQEGLEALAALEPLDDVGQVFPRHGLGVRGQDGPVVPDLVSGLLQETGLKRGQGSRGVVGRLVQSVILSSEGRGRRQRQQARQAEDAPRHHGSSVQSRDYTNIA